LFRYEDNGDQVNNLNVLVKQVGKGSITELGEPKTFLEKINYLFGDQVFTGEPFSLLPHATPCSYHTCQGPPVAGACRQGDSERFMAVGQGPLGSECKAQ